MSSDKETGKLIFVTAPSGAGKTTIVRQMLKIFPSLDFSISATTRLPRNHEAHGRDYYFLTIRDFMLRVEGGAFIEWEEVYQNQYYGTLKSEVERLWADGKDIIFDIDVHGATQLKSKFPNNSITVFIKPPSVEVLLDRLRKRKTDSKEGLIKRIKRAKKELTFESTFDHVIVNDDLKTAFDDTERLIKSFISI
jgi:guanylate kinase